MDTMFSFRRVGHILRADFTVYKIYVLYWSIACLAVWIFLSYNPVRTDTPLFHVVWILMTAVFCRYAGGKLHRPKGMYLTLPAGAGEKYAALLLEGLLLFLAHNLLYWTGTGTGWLISGLPLPLDFHELYSMSVTQVCGLFFFSSTLLFYHLTFRRAALLWYIVSYLAFVTFLIQMANLMGYPKVMGEKGIPEADTNALMAPFLVYMPAVLSVLSAGFFYLSYDKLKRKQLR